MKKRLILILVAMMILLSSCGADTPDVTTSEVPFEGMSTQMPAETPTLDQPSPTQNFVNADIVFSVYEVEKRYYGDAGGFIELLLTLPRLDGDFTGIPAINQFFQEKEVYFYNQLPFAYLGYADEVAWAIQGKGHNFYRSADYSFEVILGDIISITAYINGGAGGVPWDGLEGDTFDISTGRKLELSDVFSVSKEAYMEIIYDFVSEISLQRIEENVDAGYDSPYFFKNPHDEDGIEMIRNFNLEDFYLTENFLVVFYKKYALTSGASGVQKFEIPYEEISNILAIDITPDHSPIVAINDAIHWAYSDDFMPLDFTGTYQRTNIDRTYRGNIEISNQQYKYFDFHIENCASTNMDIRCGIAEIVSPNKAVYDTGNGEVVFWLNEDFITIEIPEEDKRNNDWFFSANGTSFYGDYTTRAPIYTNASIVDEVFPSIGLQNSVAELLGEDVHK